MHLAVIEYVPKQRLILRTPRLLRNAGAVLLILGVGMVLFVPFAAGVTWLVAQYKPYTDVIEQNKQLIFYASVAVTPIYLVLTALVSLIGIWAVRRRREIEIDSSLGAVIERERFLRSEWEKRLPLGELTKAVCMARLKSAGEGVRGGALTSYAVNLIFRDGSVVNFECLDSRLPALLEQVVPSLDMK